jgi:hypothetical protein
VTDKLSDFEGQSPVEYALAGGEPQRVGWFRFYFADQRWEWSPQVERMHGYEPGTVHPTTDLVLSHKHPDDYGQVAATLDEVQRTAGAFSTRHRIVDTRGEVHHVVVVGDHIFDDAGEVAGTHGFYVDVTPSVKEAHNVRVSEAVAEIAEARSGIEQAKGMLMLIYRISADSAFELLKWRSQELPRDQHQIACARRANRERLSRSSLRRGAACEGGIRQVAADRASVRRILRVIRRACHLGRMILVPQYLSGDEEARLILGSATLVRVGCGPADPRDASRRPTLARSRRHVSVTVSPTTGSGSSTVGISPFWRA